MNHRLSSGRPVRVWIDQPSSLQSDHKLHKKYGIVIPEKGDYVDIHFTEGDIHSMRIAKLSLAVCYLSDAETNPEKYNRSFY